VASQPHLQNETQQQDQKHQQTETKNQKHTQPFFFKKKKKVSDQATKYENMIEKEKLKQPRRFLEKPKSAKKEVAERSLKEGCMLKLRTGSGGVCYSVGKLPLILIRCSCSTHHVLRFLSI
jgi:hypothetical protein